MTSALNILRGGDETIWSDRVLHCWEKTVPVRICATHERQECMMVSPSICLVTGNIKIRWYGN